MKRLQSKLLVRAAALMGGIEPLAAYLQVKPSHIRLWIDNADVIPSEVFLRAVDCVIDRDLAELRSAPARKPDETSDAGA